MQCRLIILFLPYMVYSPTLAVAIKTTTTSSHSTLSHMYICHFLGVINLWQGWFTSFINNAKYTQVMFPLIYAYKIMTTHIYIINRIFDVMCPLKLWQASYIRNLHPQQKDSVGCANMLTQKEGYNVREKQNWRSKCIMPNYMFPS